VDATGFTTEELSVARVVLRHLYHHPQAKDTAQGIATWWLEQQRIEQTVQRVFRALDLLAVKGLVSERRGPDDRHYFELNTKRLPDIVCFLEESRP